MGNVFAGSAEEIKPGFCAKPQFDPMEGFPNGRKPRVMVATDEEMRAAQLKLSQRDYCAHHLLRLLQCKVEKWPWYPACRDFTHKFNDCQYEDYVLRMKEYERERRLLVRQKRKQEAAAA